MAVVVVKLFLFELSNTGTVARVVSFLGVGLLLMIVGYFAPVPPAETTEAIADGDRQRLTIVVNKLCVGISETQYGEPHASEDERCLREQITTSSGVSSTESVLGRGSHLPHAYQLLAHVA